jgi:hypothetical protein
MNSEHLQFLIGLISVPVFFVIIGYLIWRYNKRIREQRVFCPTCGRCYEDQWDMDEHFRRAHKPESR